MLWVCRFIPWIDILSICKNYRYFQVTSISELIPSYSRPFTSKSRCKKLAGFIRWVCRLIPWLDSFSVCNISISFQVTCISDLIPSYSRQFTSKSSSKKLAGLFHWVCRLIPWLDSFSLCKNYRYFEVTSISELIPSYSRPLTSKSSYKKLKRIYPLMSLSFFSMIRYLQSL